MYDVEAAQKGDYSKIGSDFFANSKKGFTALGVCIYITVAGLLIVKLNFLLFFKPLGAGFDAYRSAIRHGRGWRAKWQQLNESVLDKCRTLEDWPGSNADTLHGHRHGLPTVPSGLMTVDFHDDANWKKTAGGAVHMTTTTTVWENAGYYQYPQNLQYFQGPALAGSMHSEEALLQNPEAVHLRQDEYAIEVAR
ncbi:hypothetical protein C8A01DRAFT_41612 [Parachaetomium inaequale]|uniref:Uncharacterized protein n=1 Tax=Parachaetomium inaequale TaxID=2588326 RepID=A0AAN6SKP5_9PEZI|nr:hypothetical protein C8A01DRAFT_41612 [Parachaetomium inaequale]